MLICSYSCLRRRCIGPAAVWDLVGRVAPCNCQPAARRSPSGRAAPSRCELAERDRPRNQHTHGAARVPRTATQPLRRRAWLRIFVARCCLPCDPSLMLCGDHSSFHVAAACLRPAGADTSMSLQHDSDRDRSPSTGDNPGRIEPPVRRAVIGEPRDVPMADERGVGSPNPRSSTDVDHAVGIAGNRVWRLLAGPYRDNGAVLVCRSRDGAICPRPKQDDVAARQLEETPDIRRVFTAFRAFARHTPVQAELTAPTDGAHSPYIGHQLFPRRCGATEQAGEARIIQSPRRGSLEIASG
jgi:hypothetical protein